MQHRSAVVIMLLHFSIRTTNRNFFFLTFWQDGNTFNSELVSARLHNFKFRCNWNTVSINRAGADENTGGSWADRWVTAVQVGERRGRLREEMRSGTQETLKNRNMRDNKRTGEERETETKKKDTMTRICFAFWMVKTDTFSFYYNWEHSFHPPSASRGSVITWTGLQWVPKNTEWTWLWSEQEGTCLEWSRIWVRVWVVWGFWVPYSILLGKKGKEKGNWTSGCVQTFQC